MRRTVFFALLVALATAALIGGSYSALAGTGAAASVADAVIGTGEPDVDAEAQEEEAEEDDGAGAQRHGEVLADAFDVTPEVVMALHEQGIGFGALFKLYKLGAATGTSVDGLLAATSTDADGEIEFGFGELRKSLTGAQLAAIEDGPKNFGQLKKAHKNKS